MPSSAKLLGLAAAATGASAAFQGFNYGATFADGRLRVESDFESMFKAAQALPGTDGAFNSARLYTMIQGTTTDPISAIPAAIKTKTSILFGLWASAGQDAFNKELAALQKTIDQYCDQLDGLVAGISIGSEDLYRDSPIGIKAGEYAGAGPDVLVEYISEVRKTIKGTCLENAKLGHVDTWTAFVNETNKPVIQALDWIGMDAYPYFENTKPNSIEDAKGLFDAALANTEGASGGVEVWITETGYPTTGKTSGAAVASVDNARTYWEEVGCPLFGKTNTWWYTLQDSNSDNPITDDTPSFGVVGDDLEPKYNLSCKGVKPKPSSSSATPSATSASKSGSSDKTATESGSEETSTGEASASPSGMTTVSSAEPAATGSNGGSGSGSSSGSGSGAGSEETGSKAEPTPSQIPTDAGSQLKGSFGAVVVALGLTFFAL